MGKLLSLLFLLSCTIFSLTKAQTPFRFMNERKQNQESSELLMMGLKLLDQHIESSKLVKFRSKNYYEVLKDSLNERAKKAKGEIELQYSKNRYQLLEESKIRTEEDLLIFKNKMDILDKMMKDEMKVINQIEDYAKELDYKHRNLNKLKPFPVKNNIDAQLFYDYYQNSQRSKFLKNLVSSFGLKDAKVSIYNEVYYDYIEPIRFGLGILVSNTNIETSTNPNGDLVIDSASSQKDAVQRLLGGGGNFVLNTSYPFLGYTSNKENFSFKIIAAPKFSLDIPKLGTSNDKFSTNYDLGLEGSCFYTGALNVLSFYGSVRIARVYGNASFYENLSKNDRRSFGFNQSSLGVALNSTFRISWNFFWGSKFVKENFPSNIAFSIVPN